MCSHRYPAPLVIGLKTGALPRSPKGDVLKRGTPEMHLWTGEQLNGTEALRIL